MEIDHTKLRGQHVYLEKLREDHVAYIKTLIKDERLWEFTRTLIIDDTFDEQFEKYIAHAFDPNGMGNQFSFVMRRTIDDSIIGMTRYYFYEPKDKRVAIGFTWYIPEVWGQVYNKECKLLLLQYAFEDLGLNRVEFHVAHKNIRSQKAMLKIGAEREGVLRNYAIQPDGSIRHTHVFSIIKEEWPEKKERLREMVRGEE